MKIFLFIVGLLVFIYLVHRIFLLREYYRKRKVAFQKEKSLSTDYIKPLPKNASEDLIELMEETKKGNSEAQVKLGIRYLRGNGVSCDYSEAINFFRKSVFSKTTVPVTLIAQMYLLGLGVPKNFSKAFELLNYTTDNPVANNILGDIYFEGEFVEQDYDAALTYYRRATFGNIFPDAFINLAVMYFLGCGVKKNIKKVIYYLEKASALEDPYAQKFLADLYLSGEVLEIDSSKAIDLYLRAAKNGNKEAMDKLATISGFGDLKIKDKFGMVLSKVVNSPVVDINQESQEDSFDWDRSYNDKIIANKWKKKLGKGKKSLGSSARKKKS
jgi:TPR repeat protein